MTTIPIEDQIAELEREHKVRLRVYPLWVRDGRLSMEESAHRVACMAAAIDTLKATIQPTLL